MKNDKLGKVLLPTVFLLVLSAACADRPAEVLQAGAAAVDVTPPSFPVTMNCMFLPRIAEEALDRLHARSLVLDDGENRVAITVVDNCMMPRELLDQAKEMASKTTGIPTDRMLISATHTHSAPVAMGCLGTDADPEYEKFLMPRIVQSIEEAAANLAPARIGWTVAKDPEHTYCRRWVLRPDRMREDPFGEVTVRAGNGAGNENPDVVGPAGPVDPDLSILSVQSADGRPVALLANYSMHYVVGSPSVTADYFGQFAERIKQLVGAENVDPPFVGIMSQGTSGDAGWQDPSRPRQQTTIQKFADEVAQVAYRAYQDIEYLDWATVAMSERKLPLERRLADASRLAWAKKTVEEMNGRPPKDRPEIYAREQLLLAAEPQRELKLQALRIGDLGITAIPNEVYAITGLKIKVQSPLEPTFNIELANGSEGYIPPPEQHKLGGYTTWEARTAALEVNAEPMIVDTVLELLEEVSGKPRRPVREVHGAYAQAVLASKPLAYWRLGEFRGGQALDASGHDRQAAYEDGVAFYLEGPNSPGFSGEGHINRAPHFAGGRVTAEFETLVDPHTVEMWFYNGLPGDARSVTGYLFSWGSVAAKSDPRESLGIGGTGAAPDKLLFTPGTELKSALSGTKDIAMRTWHHVALVREGSDVAVYLNGNETPEISGRLSTKSAATRGKLFIGGRSDNVANFEGKIDEVAVYDRALPAGEIAGHFAASRDIPSGQGE